ncbi:18393_t:CDS:1, partial [Acaulospora morrowiae]
IEKELAELIEQRNNSIFFKDYYQKKILEKEEEWYNLKYSEIERNID